MGKIFNTRKRIGRLDAIMHPDDLDNKRSELDDGGITKSDERWLKYTESPLYRKSIKGHHQSDSFDSIISNPDDLDWNRAQRKKKSKKSKTKRKTKKCKCK